jgi:hypothetical protein
MAEQLDSRRKAKQMMAETAKKKTGALTVDMYMFMCYIELMKDTRLIALIEAKQMRALRAAAKREKVSLAEVVRRAINLYLKAVK